MYPFCDVIIYLLLSYHHSGSFVRTVNGNFSSSRDTSTIFFSSLISQMFEMSRTYPLFNELYSFVALRR